MNRKESFFSSLLSQTFFIFMLFRKKTIIIKIIRDKTKDGIVIHGTYYDKLLTSTKIKRSRKRRTFSTNEWTEIPMMLAVSVNFYLVFLLYDSV